MNTYGLLKTAMDVSNKRAELISSNIANVNTDNYKAKRISFESELQKAIGKNQFSLTTTNEKHMNHLEILEPKVIVNEEASLKENGNNVDLEVEMMNQATNGLYYSAMTAQLNGRYQMLSDVLRS